MAARPTFAQLAAKLMQQQTGKMASGGSGGGAPNLGKAVGGGAGVIALAAVGLALNSALFNGSFGLFSSSQIVEILTNWIFFTQWMEDLELSSILD